MGLLMSVHGFVEPISAFHIPLSPANSAISDEGGCFSYYYF